MPDQYGFNHLPNWGLVTHRCIECDWPGHGITVSEDQRAKHRRAHVREIRKEQERVRKHNLAKARRARKQATQT